jgi:hypothetical protein
VAILRWYVRIHPTILEAFQGVESPYAADVYCEPCAARLTAFNYDVSHKHPQQDAPLLLIANLGAPKSAKLAGQQAAMPRQKCDLVLSY